MLQDIELLESGSILKGLCFPHAIANKLTGFLLFSAVPTINWSFIPIAIVAIIATFAATNRKV